MASEARVDELIGQLLSDSAPREILDGLLPPQAAPASFVEGAQMRLTLLRSLKEPQGQVKCRETAPLLPADHTPDPALAIAAYVSRWVPPYRAAVESLAEQIPSMDRECRISICMPVAAHEESEFIGRALGAFAAQQLPCGLFEIVLFANYPASRAAAAAETGRQIACFQKRHPDLAVHAMWAALEDSLAGSIGFIRSLLTDAVLLRHGERHNGRDHILGRADADTRAADPRWAEHLLRSFDRKPHVDAFAGQLVYAPEHFGQDPLLFVNQMLTSIIQTGCRIYRKQPLLGGPNFAVRAGVYACVDGYPELAQVAEDVGFGKRLLLFRLGAKEHSAIEYAGRSRLYTSSRRAEVALRQGTSCINQWFAHETRFGAENSRVRCLEPQGGSEWDSLPPEARLKLVEKLINQILVDAHSHWPGVTARCRPVEKGLGLYLGLEYAVTGRTSIRITDGSEFLRRVAGLQDSTARNWRAWSQAPEPQAASPYQGRP